MSEFWQGVGVGLAIGAVLGIAGCIALICSIFR